MKKWLVAVMCLFICTSAVQAGDGDGKDTLIDILKKKSVLNEEEAALLKGKKSPAEEEDVWKEAKVKVGGLLKLSALFEDPQGQADNNNYFKVDDVSLNIKGSYGKDFEFLVQPHCSLSTQGGGTVDTWDMFIEYVRFPVKFRLGKTQYPGSLGAFLPAAKLDFATRPKMCAETALPQCRDIGLMLYGDPLVTKVCERELKLRLYGMVSNGKKPRTTAMGEGMMFTTRAELTVEKLVSFGACYLTDYQTHELGEIQTGGYGDVDYLRYGATDATVFLGPCRFGGEFIHGRVEDASVAKPFEGYYLFGFYNLNSYAEVGARYEKWDRNRSERFRTEEITAGVNFMFNPKNPHSAKLQLDWRKTREGDPARTDVNAVQVLLQLLF